jgi:two-component system clock-associated histidine kinase SasA
MNIFDNPVYLLPPLIASAISLVLIFIVLSSNFRSFVHRLFALVLFSACLWGISIYQMRSSPDLEQALIWSKLVNVFIPMVIVFLYHFTLIYTGIRPKKMVIPLVYSFLLLNIAIVPTNLLIVDMQLKSYGYAPVVGPLFFPVAVIDYVLIILGLYNLLKAYREATNYEIKNRYLYVTIGLFIALIAGFGDVLPLIGVHLYPGAIFGHIIFYLLTTVAIIRYHLLDISIAVRKGVAYIIMSVLVAIPYVGIIIGLAHFFGGIQLQIWGYAILLLILAAALQPLWNIVQSWVNRWYYGPRYRNIQELIDLGKQHFSVKTPHQVTDRYLEIAQKAMGARGAYLLLPDESNTFIMKGSTGQNHPNPIIIFKYTSPIIYWFRSHNDPISADEMNNIPQLQALTVLEKQAVEESEAHLFVPLKYQNEELCGILVLTKKYSEQSYSGEERSTLLMIANQIAVSLDNIRLYQLEREMRNELQKQNDQKTEFLHTIAHEMKTPLTSLLASSELLNERLSENDNIGERLVTNIKRSAGSMNRRVSELVDLAGMQSGKISFKAEPLEIGREISEIASDLDSIFESKRQKLLKQIPDSLPKAYADRGRLEQILFNLLSNANKFSPNNSEIVLRVKESNNSIIVEVEDEAPTITEAEKSKIFDPYYRSEDTTKQDEVPGLGLGLYITKMLVEMHNGKILVNSSPTKGNIFSFSLPTLE